MSEEKKANKTKEQLVAFGKDVAENYNEAIKDDKKNTKILFIIGGVLFVLIVGWWLFGSGGEDEIKPATGNQGVAEDINYDIDKVDIKEYSLHDEKLVGMWGPDGYNVKDFDGGSWEAYKFDENGFVMKAIGENGQTFVEHGTWSSNDNGEVYISWKDSNEEEFFNETVDYKVIDNEDEGKVLVFNDNDMFPLDDDCMVIFS